MGCPTLISMKPFGKESKIKFMWALLVRLKMDNIVLIGIEILDISLKKPNITKDVKHPLQHQPTTQKPQTHLS